MHYDRRQDFRNGLRRALSHPKKLCRAFSFTGILMMLAGFAMPMLKDV